MKQLKKFKHVPNSVTKQGLNKIFQKIHNRNKSNNNYHNDINNLNKDRKYGETCVNKKFKRLKSATKP